MNLSRAQAISHEQLPRTEGAASALWTAFATARSAWPSINLAYSQFYEYVTRDQTSISAPAYPADVYLCVACVSGHPVAHRSLEAKYFPTLASAILHVVGARPAVDDVLQEVRARLFVGHAPKLASYRGTGSLAGWLRQVAMRASLDYRREAGAQRYRLRKFFHEECASVKAQPEPTAEYGHHPPAICEQAWRRAVTSLPPRERQLLYHYFVLGLSIDALSPIYAVHRSTIARRMNRIIKRLRRQVHKMLSAHYSDLSSDELDALVLRSCGDVELGELAS
jgi:RNA polymerase sigma-70 factor